MWDTLELLKGGVRLSKGVSDYPRGYRVSIPKIKQFSERETNGRLRTKKQEDELRTAQNLAI